MRVFGKTTIKMSLIILLIVGFSFSSFANEVENVVDENDSIYKYGALENKVYFYNTENNDAEIKRLEESLPVNKAVEEKILKE